MIESALLQRILAFRNERDWQKFHTPKNLAISISIEAGELLEHFQWTKDDAGLQPHEASEVAKEMADILIYLLLMAHTLEIDLEAAAYDKLKDNARKYPIDKAKGNATKYTEL